MRNPKIHKTTQNSLNIMLTLTTSENYIDYIPF